jgi:hypothetical protein
MHKLSDAKSQAVTGPFVIIDDFLPADLAHAMRKDIDEHFGHPSDHRPDSHQIWNYWHVPGSYTYLRTRPEKVIDPSRVDVFINTLRDWSIDVFGFARVTRPYLSLYVAGCGQGLHNDSKNGRFAFVYSLTRNDRRTSGGETIVLREGDLFRRNLRVANAGIGFRELIEPRFNRLVIFDDRLVHGVERLDGSMDPGEGRFVLHGHLEEAGPIITGSLPLETLRPGICAAVDRFVTDYSAAIHLYHGPLVLRLQISREGTVRDIRVILDRVIDEQGGSSDWKQIKEDLLDALRKAAFPTAQHDTKVTLPITFGGPVFTAGTSSNS